MRMSRRSFAAALPLLAACQQSRAPGAEAPAASVGWSRAPDAPFAVQEIYPALHDGAIWIAGGFAPLAALGATRRVIAFDLAANEWREEAELPTVSHHVHLASLNGDLWAIGGFLGGDNRRSWICTTRVLELDGDTWVEGPPLPKPIGEAVPLAHAGQVHLIGGRSPRGEANAGWNDQGDVGDHFVFDGAAWRTAAPLPSPRNSAAGAVLNGQMHIISGRTVADGQTPAHHVYDPAADAWREAAPFPEPRGGLGAALFDGAIIAGGGEIFEPGSVGDALYAYDANADAWARSETLPTPRHGYGLIAAGDALYALGGARRVGGDGTLASVDVFRNS